MAVKLGDRVRVIVDEGGEFFVTSDIVDFTGIDETQTLVLRGLRRPVITEPIKRRRK